MSRLLLVPSCPQAELRSSHSQCSDALDIIWEQTQGKNVTQNTVWALPQFCVPTSYPGWESCSYSCLKIVGAGRACMGMDLPLPWRHEGLKFHLTPTHHPITCPPPAAPLREPNQHGPAGELSQ